MSLVALQGARLGYGADPVFEAVSFTLAAGERVVFLGRSGSGKTTLLNASYDALMNRGMRAALVPQEMALVPQLSVAKNVLMGRLDDHGALQNLAALLRTPSRTRAEILGLLDELGLAGFADRPVEGLSGGQKQRTALARAFYRGGDVILGDEPLSALDEAHGAALLDAISRRYPTAVLALHDVALARSFATRLIGVRAGQILFDAPPAVVTEAQIGTLYAA